MPSKPSLEQIRERLAREPLVRTFVIERDASEFDEESRTVNLAFASDTPVTQFSWTLWDWFELSLSMKKGAMRTERLENGAPLLMDHDTRDQVGVIEGFSVDKDGKARADVRFSKSARGEEVYRDVVDGIRRSVSVGFMVHDMTLKEERKGKPNLYISNDWEPYEVSLVSVPADISVGVGRSAEPVQQTLRYKLELDTTEAERHLEQFSSASHPRAIPNNTEKPMEEKDKTPDTPVVEPRSAEREAAERAAAIMDFAAIFGEQGTQIARQMLAASDAVTLDDVRTAIRNAQPPSTIVPPETPESVAARAGVRTELARSLPRYGKLKAFQGDGAEERAHRFGQFVLGGPLGLNSGREFCQKNGIKLERAQSEGLNEKGGYFVPEDFGNDIIDLIEKHGVFRTNTKIRPMTRDTASDPRITGELEAYFVGESTAGTESDFETDRVSLTAKKLMTLVTYSSEISEDAVVSIGDEIAMLSARAFAKKEDNCGFNGDGSGTYGGIVGVREKLKGLSGTIANIAGLQVGTGNAYSELVLADFRGVVARLPEYADEDAAWYVHRSFYWNVMVAALLAGGGVTAAEIENTRNKNFLGYPVRFSQVMPKVEANSQVCALFGDLAMGSKLGDRRQYTIALSEHVRFTADDTVFKATSRFDINVHSVGNASATAADREAGPIVGLITAAS